MKLRKVMAMVTVACLLTAMTTMMVGCDVSEETQYDEVTDSGDEVNADDVDDLNDDDEVDINDPDAWWNKSDDDDDDVDSSDPDGTDGQQDLS